MEQLFQSLGFSAAETKVYLALAEAGKATGTNLSKRTGLPRSSAYSILQGLIGRGIVSIEHDQEIAYYVPNPPVSLKQMIETEREDALRVFQEKQQAAEELNELVAPFFRSAHYSVPRIQFFEGKKNVEAMLYAHENQWQESISHFDYTWWGYQDVQFVQEYRRWLDHYWAQLKPEEQIQLITNKSETERKLRGKIERRKVKTVPKGKEISSTIWVLGEYVVLIMTRQQPNYAFQMKDSVFAANQRSIFQLLWELLD